MSDDCKDVLLAKNFGNFSYRHYSSLFLLQLIEKSNYDSAKTKIGAAIPDMFSGDYDNFETSRANEFSRLNLNISDDEALSALHVTGYAGATSAWQQCMSKNRKELFTVVVGNISDLIFDVQIYWEPPTGNTGSPLKNVQIWLSGEGGVVTIENADRLPRELKPGKDVIQVRRSSNKTIVRGYVKGDLGTSVCSSIIYVPKFVADPQFAPVYLAKRPDLLVPGSVKNVHGEPKNRFGMRVDDCLVWGGVYWQANCLIGSIDYTGNVIGMHPPQNGPGSAEFYIPDGARHFKTKFGLAHQDGNSVKGLVQGRIYTDDNIQWSGNVSSETVIQSSIVNISPEAKKLKLEVHSMGDNYNDHSCWVEPIFI